MTEACPIPTPEQRRYGAILADAEAEMMRTVLAAVEEAAERTRTDVEAAGLAMTTPDLGYFLATAHQQLFCALCGADPETLAGGKAPIAIAVIRNCQTIAKHRWGAAIEPHPRS